MSDAKITGTPYVVGGIRVSFAVPDTITGGLVSYWRFNEGSGAVAADSIGGHTAAVGQPPANLNGCWDNTSGSCLTSYFDGTNFYAARVATGSYYNTNSLTIFFWGANGGHLSQIYFSHADTGFNQQSWIVQNGTADNTLMEVKLSSDGVTTDKDYTTSVQANFGAYNWHSFAFTFDGSTSALKLYVDGIRDGSPAITANNPISSLFNSPADITFAIGLSSGAYVGSGINRALRQFRFYNVVKTDAQILAIHNLGSTY
jgi:hypothetical protein